MSVALVTYSSSLYVMKNDMLNLYKNWCYVSLFKRLNLKSNKLMKILIHVCNIIIWKVQGVSQ